MPSLQHRFNSHFTSYLTSLYSNFHQSGAISSSRRFIKIYATPKASVCGFAPMAETIYMYEGALFV